MLGIRAELSLALFIADSVFEDKGFDCVVTSLRDGTHKPGSWHYSGWAADLRSKHLGSEAIKGVLLEALLLALGSQWEVILEHLGKPNEHLHLEPSNKMKATK